MSVRKCSTRTTLRATCRPPRRACDVVDDEFGLRLGGEENRAGADRLPRRHEPVAVDRHEPRHEQQVARLHRLRLIAECGCDAGVDVALFAAPPGFTAMTLISILPS